VATNYIAKNDEIKVNAGSDPEVTLKITRSSHKKENLSFAFNGRQQFLQGWDTYDQFKLELKNFRDRAVEFEVNLVFNGDFDFESELAATKVDFRTQRYTLRMDKGARQEVVYKVRTRFGTNARK
jgi:glycogen debranching enzyme